MATVQADGLQALLNRLGVEDSVNSYPSADVLTRPLDIYRAHLAEVLLQFTECEPQVAYDSIQEPNDYGDLEVVVPRLRIKGSNPKDLALELAQKFPETPLFDQPFEDGIHVRLYISPENLARILLPYVLDRGKSYGSSYHPWLRSHDAPGDAKTRVIVEFSSPNLGKEFDSAHLRSTIIGSSIASLYEGMGWDVCRMNFLGDWGKHIGLLAVGWSMFGSDERLEVEPLRHLLNVYTNIDKLSRGQHLATKEVSIDPQNKGEAPVNETVPISTKQDDFFKNMEDGDSDALALSKRFRDVSVAEYAKLYAKLNINFDDYSGESQVSKATIAEVEAALDKKGVSEDSNGNRIIDFNKHGSRGLGTVTLRHSNGTTSYLLRDVGAVLERTKKHNFDKMIYVVSARQDNHFQQLFRTLELMGDKYHELAQTLHHVNFNAVRGLSPPSESSGLLLSDILEQCRNAMRESLQSSGVDGKGSVDDANEFARLAVMSQELSTKRSNTSNFTLGTDEKIAALPEHYPGLRLQRWLDSLRSKDRGTEATRNLEHEDLDYTLFEQEEAYADMLRLIARFPYIAKHAFEKLDPSIVFSYLLQVIEMLPSVWDEDGDKDCPESTEPSSKPEELGEGSRSREEASEGHETLKIAFYDCVRTVLENGMNFIGLVPIKERERKSAGTDTASPQKVSEDTPLRATTQELNEETTLSGASQEADDETADEVAPGGLTEVFAEVANPKELNEETTLLVPEEAKHSLVDVAVLEGVNEAATEVANPQDAKEDAGSTTVLQEISKEAIPSAAPQEESDKAAPEEVDEGVTEIAKTQDGKEEVGPTAIPHQDNEEDELKPTPASTNKETDTANIPEDDNEEPAHSTIAQEMTEITTIATPHGFNEDAALATTPGEESMEAASTPTPHEVNGDTALTAVPREVGED